MYSSTASPVNPQSIGHTLQLSSVNDGSAPLPPANHVAFYPCPQDQKGRIVDLLKDCLKTSDNFWLQGVSREWMAAKSRVLKTRVDIDNTNRVATVHISCVHDNILIDLAKKLSDHPMKFPRGFAFLLDLNTREIIGISAFYPKFSNDNRQSDFSVGDFKDDRSIDLHIKYSGFLGKVILFEHPTEGLSYATFSKNSASFNRPEQGDSTSFCQKVKDIVGQDLDQEKIKTMWDEGIRGFCCEVMSTGDIYHGYDLKKDGYVVTAVSTEKNEFHGPQQMYDTCSKYSLPADAPVHIMGEEAVKSFISELTDVRDTLTYTQLQYLFRKHNLPFNNYHGDIIDSAAVEGFVIRKPNGERVKFKCWPYQMVTMGLRSFMKGESFYDDKITSRALHEDNGKMNYEMESLINQELGNWVVSKNPKVRKIARWLIESSVAEEKKHARVAADRPLWIQYSTAVLEKFDSVMVKHNFNLDTVYQELEPEMSLYPQTTLKERTVVLVLGPVGYGKSTFANKLENANGAFQHIDGDTLNIDAEVVTNLKQRRNLTTCAVVGSSLITGRIPVLSTGGGAVLYRTAAQKGEHGLSYLQAFLKNMGIDGHFRILVPGAEFRKYQPDECDQRLCKEYQNEDAVRATVEQRCQSRIPGWAMSKIGSFCQRSSENETICRQWLTHATSAYTYPRSDTERTYSHVDFQQIARQLLSEDSEHSPLGEVKSRALQQYYTCPPVKIQTPNRSLKGTVVPEKRIWHRTLDFSPALKDMVIPAQQASPGTKIDASFKVILDKADEKFLCSFVKLPQAPNAHLTIEKGKFQAKDMGLFATAISQGKEQVSISDEDVVEFKTLQKDVTVQAHQVVALSEIQ